MSKRHFGGLAGLAGRRKKTDERLGIVTVLYRCRRCRVQVTEGQREWHLRERCPERVMMAVRDPVIVLESAFEAVA